MVEVSAIPFWSLDVRFYHYIRVNFTFKLLDCDRISGISLYRGLLDEGFAPYILV